MPTVSYTHPGALRSRQSHTIVVYKEPQATGSEQTLRIVRERAGTGGIVYGGSRAYRTVILVVWAFGPSTRIIRARLCYRHPSSAKLIGACGALDSKQTWESSALTCETGLLSPMRIGRAIRASSRRCWPPSRSGGRSSLLCAVRVQTDGLSGRGAIRERRIDVQSEGADDLVRWMQCRCLR